MYYAADDQKMADKKKVDYQEGLEKSRADSAARSRDSYMKDLEKSCARSRESYMKDPEKSVQHEAVKVTRATWRRVTKIVLHGAVSIGVGTGGLGASAHPIFCYVLRSLQLSKTDI